MGMHNNLQDETSYTTQYKDGILKYVDNEYRPKHRHWPIIEPDTLWSDNPVPWTKVLESGQPSFDPHD